jgi:predicted nucleotidyltransferase
LDIKETLIEQLKSLIHFLSKHETDYALAGGLAYSALVEPRATMDIDILIMFKEKEMPTFIEQLSKKFKSIIPHKEPMRFNLMNIWRVISIIDNREMIFHFLLAESNFQRNVIDRAFEILFFETKLKIITIEDLILLKNCAMRAQNIADLKKIYSTYKTEIDYGYVEYWADKLKLSLYKTPNDRQ